MARCLNCHHKRWENLWSTERTGALLLGDAQAIFDKQLYPCDAVKDQFNHRLRVRSRNLRTAARAVPPCPENVLEGTEPPYDTPAPHLGATLTKALPLGWGARSVHDTDSQ